ncbi:hypothetical protein HYD43_02435 [Mycoplasmopsis bovis]|nr:hypothetical protein [Mycoplasmopsis bovis]QQH84011.1 hypothetical protein HYD43_02435 [Mycoplasmopsis bovis]
MKLDDGKSISEISQNHQAQKITFKKARLTQNPTENQIENQLINQSH